MQTPTPPQMSALASTAGQPTAHAGLDSSEAVPTTSSGLRSANPNLGLLSGSHSAQVVGKVPTFTFQKRSENLLLLSSNWRELIQR